MDNKKFILISISMSILFLIIGASFAWARWESGENTAVTFTVGNGYSCSADGGGDITSSQVKIAPATCTDSNYAIKRTITLNTAQSVPIDLNMWLTINQIDTALSGTENFRYALTTNNNSCTTGLVASGTFEGTDSLTNNKIMLLDTKNLATSTNTTYYLYIWLDEVETDVNTANKSFSFSLEGDCTDEITNKYYAALNSWSGFYKQDEYRENITSIEVVHNKNYPENAVTFNLGTSPSQPDDVIGWLEDDGSGNNTYKLYLGADGIIKVRWGNASSGFRGMKKVSYIDLNDMDFSEATDLSLLFQNVGIYADTVTIDLGKNFFTPNVTTMREMFYSLGSNSNDIDINFGNKFVTTNVNNMRQMFAYAGYNGGNLNLNLSFDTSNVTNMQSMFERACFNCTGTVNINLGNKFDTSNVTDMNLMFMFVGRGDQQKVQSVNLNLGNKFNPHLVQNFSRMFESVGFNAISFNFNLGNSFNTINATNMANMFKDFGRSTTESHTLNLGNSFNTHNVTNMAYMFSQCYKSVNGTWTVNLGNNFDTSSVTDMSHMFEYSAEAANTVYMDFGDKFNTSLVTNMTGFMSGFGSTTNTTSFYLDLGYNFNTSSLVLANNMFRFAGVAPTNSYVQLGNMLNFSKVTDAVDAFKGLGGHASNSYILDFSSGNFSNLTNYSQMFNSLWGAKPTIYVDSANTKQWLIDTFGESNQTFSAANIIVK